MKKFIAIATLFCVLLCCVGCSSRNSGEIVSTPSDVDTLSETVSNPPDDDTLSESVSTPLDADTLSEINRLISDSYADGENTEPPCMLFFYSLDEIAELYNILSEDDETVDEYLASKSFDMNGLNSKNDVVEFFEHIGDLGILHLNPASGYEFTFFLYYVEDDYFITIYARGEDIVKFAFYPGAETKSDSSISIGTEYAGTIDIGGTPVGLHDIGFTRSNFTLYGGLNTDNSRITILLTDNDEGVIEYLISKNIIRTTLMDLIKK